MPEGTPVDTLYKKFLSEGKSEASAAKLAQFITKTSLMTGKAPKRDQKPKKK